jgi:hypothetical protein
MPFSLSVDMFQKDTISRRHSSNVVLNRLRQMRIASTLILSPLSQAA